MNQYLKQMLRVSVCLFALTGSAIADALDDAKRDYNAGNYAKAAAAFKELAQLGDAQAQFNLGAMYSNGLGVPRDYKESVKWCRRAAEQGHAIAQTKLGMMYGNGYGVPQDYQEAVKWYRLAAEQGEVEAQGRLGSMYGLGRGVPQNSVLAHMWLNIAITNVGSKGLNDIVAVRDLTAKNMSASQIAEAQALARKCTAQKFKGC